MLFGCASAPTTTCQMPLIHHRPQNRLEAKFSMEFCMAILLLERRLGLPSSTDEVVMRPDVKAMIEKVDFVRGPGGRSGRHTTR